MFTKLCIVEMDLSHIPLYPRSKTNGAPGTFYYLGYDLVLFFSSVEMRAQIAWEEDVSGLLSFALSDRLLNSPPKHVGRREEESREDRLRPRYHDGLNNGVTRRFAAQARTVLVYLIYLDSYSVPVDSCIYTIFSCTIFVLSSKSPTEALLWCVCVCPNRGCSVRPHLVLVLVP